MSLDRHRFDFETARQRLCGDPFLFLLAFKLISELLQCIRKFSLWVCNAHTQFNTDKAIQVM
jgi:hypothetical protein